MNELERYVDEVSRGLRGSASLREHLREELREHLLAAVETHVAAGLGREEAEAKAIEQFGRPEMVREGLEAVYGRRFIGLLIERAMEWKARTIETGWKWRFLAHACLLGLLVLEALLILAGAVFILPLLSHAYDSLGGDLPGYTQSTVWLVIGAGEYWYVWLGVLAIAWAVFEWRCRSASKPAIRLAIAALAALAMTVLVCLTSAAVAVPMARLPRLMHSQQSESGVRRRLTRAGASFARLSQAARSEDWAAAEEPARALRESMRFLAETPLAASALATIHQQEELHDIRRLVERLAELSEDVHDAIRRGALVESQMHFAALRESYDRLRAHVPGWPTTAKPPATRPVEAGKGPATRPGAG